MKKTENITFFSLMPSFNNEITHSHKNNFNKISFGATMMNSIQIKEHIMRNKLRYTVALVIVSSIVIFSVMARYKCQLEGNQDGSQTCYKYKKVSGRWKRTGDKWPDKCPAPPICP